MHGGHQLLSTIKTVTLGSLTLKEPEYGSGSKAISINSPSDIKYIRITDFSDDGIPPNHEFVTAETVEDKYTLEHEDILFARSGATAGKTFIYTADIGEAIFAGYCIRFQFDCMKVIPKFVYFYTKTQRYQSWVNSIQRPSGQPNINKEEFKSFTIPLPPFEIQRSLVEEIEAARQVRKQKLAQADELLSSLNAYLLDQLGLTEPEESDQRAYAVRLKQVKGSRCDSLYYEPGFIKIIEALAKCSFPLVSLGDIVLDPVGGATPKRSDVELYADDGVKFLRILNVKPYEINLSDIKFVTDVVHLGELARSQLKKDDVLMTITGRVGTAAVVPQDILPANINQHIVRLRIHRVACLPTYLAAYLNSSIGLGLSNRSVTGGTRIALDYEAIRSLQVPLPPTDVQEAIVNEVETRRTEARQLRQEAETEWEAAKTRFERKLLGEEA